MSLRFKLFGAFLVLIIVPLVVLAVALYTLVTGLIEEKHSRQTELTLRALSQSVGFIFREMNQVTDSTIASDAIQDVLNDAYGEDVEDIDYLNLNEVQQKFRELLVYHPSVSYALMYALDDGRIHRIFTKERFQAMP
ncbi:MAG: two-component sensor histidine kinase, partial [Paenibacillaceae bacterium]